MKLRRAASLTMGEFPAGRPGMRAAGFGLLFAALAVAGPAAESTSLSTALAMHASFDQGLAADYSRGDPVMYAYASGTERKRGGTPVLLGEPARIASGAGRFGGALERTTRHPQKLCYRMKGVLDYDPADWSGTISLWLRISPDEDLDPGYCDPVMLLGNDSKQGFIFAEWWSADRGPKVFRYAVRPRQDIWNPEGRGWEEIAPEARPMVQVERTPFSRKHWTHVVLTFDHVNAGKRAVGRLYLDGERRGGIDNWDLTFGWDGTNLLLVLGSNYIGMIDDLAVFDRALGDAEVTALHGLPRGVEVLR